MHDGSAAYPYMVGSSQEFTKPDRSFDFRIFNPVPAKPMTILRAEDILGFGFHIRVASLDGLIYKIEFTDDAGLHWRIDQDLHLTKLAERHDPHPSVWFADPANPA